MSHQQDILFMRRALELAALGSGCVAPNPLVGCVVVHQGRIIGEGWHRQYGGPHAEVNALDAVEDKSLLAESTVYVSLEPCTHWGNTPPCTDLLLRHRPRRVLICNADPNPQAAGGAHKLREAGIEVDVGLLSEEGYALNRRFFTALEKKRPYILLKWAQTADGYMARTDFSSKWISNPLARRLVHKWRAEEAAVLVGRQTALYDNPQLTVRDWPLPAGRSQPLRLLIDRYAQLPQDLTLFTDGLKTWVFGLEKEEEKGSVRWFRLTEEDFLPALFTKLHQEKIQSVFIEGGPGLLARMMEQGLWDEARIISAPHSFGSGLAAPRAQGRLLSQEQLGDNRLEVWTR